MKEGGGKEEKKVDDGLDELLNELDKAAEEKKGKEKPAVEVKSSEQAIRDQAIRDLEVEETIEQIAQTIPESKGVAEFSRELSKSFRELTQAKLERARLEGDQKKFVAEAKKLSEAFNEIVDDLKKIPKKSKQKHILPDSSSSSSFSDENISELNSMARRRKELSSQPGPEGYDIVEEEQEVLAPASVSPQPSISQAPEDDDFYGKLAKEIKDEKRVRDKDLSKQKDFRRQINHVLPVLEKNIRETKALLAQAQGVTAEEEKLIKRLQTLEKIEGMLISLKSLSRNQHRYADSYLADRLQRVLSEVPANNSGKALLEGALNDMLKDNVYNPAKGTKSVSFDANKEKMDFDPKKTKKIK